MSIAAALNSLWEVRINGTMEGQTTANVLHFKCVGATADVNLHLILVLAACFVDNLLPVLTSAWTLISVSWKQVAPTLGVEQVTIPPGAGAGAGNVACLPSYVSAVISKRTLTGGRDHRGRMYIPGIPETFTTGSNITNPSDLWTGIANFIICVLAAFRHPDPAGGTDIFDLIVYSRKLGGSAFPYQQAGVTAVESLVPVQALGTTRSRKVGRGS